MDTLKKQLPESTVEKPKKKPGTKNTPAKTNEPGTSPLPSNNPPDIKPGTPAPPKTNPKQPEKHPGGPVEDDAKYPQEFKSKEKLKKEAKKIRESERLE